MSALPSHKVGNYTFQWTDLHLPRSKTDPLRDEYDVLGSQTVSKLQALAQKRSETLTNENKQSRRKIDFYEVLQENYNTDNVLSAFWQEVHSVPSWVDWEQLERGQKFFYRYALANLMGFAFQGFVGENSAASGVVEVLVRTGGFSTRVLPKRLLETFQFILQVTKSIDDIRPGGDAHVAAIRVRLLHSAVRERILNIAKTRTDYYSIEKHGVPINTLDSIHSISTFCCNHMWLQLPFMGVYPSEQEKGDYIALWRYIGYLLGTPTDYFSSVAQAKATMDSMLLHERQLTPTSLIVGYNFVQSIKDVPPVNVSKGFIEAGSRVMNGDEFCDSLDFDRPGFIHYACFQGHCWLVRILALAQGLIPGLDGALVDFFKRTLHGAIIQGGLGGGSKFDFKHVPKEEKLTKREEAPGRIAGLNLVFRPLETVLFLVFLGGSFALAGAALALLYAVSRFVL
jgi:hypothetical protein